MRVKATPKRPRVRRAEQKRITRERLIEAARVVFARRGFHRAGLEEIADEAGYSTGAIYSSFSGKEELFLAVLDEHIARRLNAVDDVVGQAGSPVERARAGAGNWMRFLADEPAWYPLFIEFWAYAHREPKLRAQVARRFAAFPRANARLLADGLADAGVTIDAERAAQAGLLLTAVSDGLALIKVMDPDAVPDELFGEALAAVLELVLAKAG